MPLQLCGNIWTAPKEIKDFCDAEKFPLKATTGRRQIITASFKRNLLLKNDVKLRHIELLLRIGQKLNCSFSHNTLRATGVLKNKIKGQERKRITDMELKRKNCSKICKLLVEILIVAKTSWNGIKRAARLIHCFCYYIHESFHR